jgi:hypothetical protein
MGAAGTGTPLLPPSFVAGTISISAAQANAPQQLSALVRAQLDPNTPGSAYDVFISTDSSGGLYLGHPSPTALQLSTSNYGRYLAAAASSTAQGNSASYGSNFPGTQSTLDDIWVLMSTTGTFHVEIH